MGKILIIMNEKVILDKFISYAEGYKYECIGCLWSEKANLIKDLEDIENLEILVLEIKEPLPEVKKIIKLVRKKFKDCKILALFPEMNEIIEEFIIEYSIDLYLTFPILPLQFLRSLYLLKQF